MVRQVNSKNILIKKINDKIIIPIAEEATCGIIITKYFFKYKKPNEKDQAEQKNRLKLHRKFGSENLNNFKKPNFPRPLYLKLSKEETQAFLEVESLLKTNDPTLYQFYIDLKEKTNIENLRNFIINSNKINIIYQNKIIKNTLKRFLGLSTILGKYCLKNKQITLYTNKKSTLYHELLHAASNDNEEDLYYAESGFYSIFYGCEMGEGLNEGYTEIQNNRKFNNKQFHYLLFQKLTLLIEQFYTNKEDMENDYYNANIFGLIDELMNYMTIDEVIDIICDIDNINDKSIIAYYKIKKKLLHIYIRTHNEEENKNFKKLYHKNIVRKILEK
jgi:hypothetical protein